MLEATLSVRGYEVMTRTSAEAALALLEEREFDVLVADVNLGPGRLSGLELCERLKAQRPELLTVVMTAFGSMETAVSALRVGAHDFITKPIENELFRLLIERAVRHRHLRSEVRRLRRAVESTRSYEEILGGSPAMGSLFRLIERVAKSAASVLITGESGTGKELVARAIHARSGRGEAPFVAVNCAAMPEPLLESELFGHAKGAFTDARAARGGLFVKAQGGTLFLDEIGELPITLQPKILRALQERAVRPVGSDQEIPIDVRFNVIHVELPPLRSRGGDVLLLAQHFVAHHAAVSQKPVRGISSEAASRLQQYPWPGNVRELQNCMERAVALTEYDEITVEDLPERVRKHRSSHVVVASNDPSELVSLEEVERRYILKVLDAVGGNKTMAGKILGLDRKTLYRKMERWGIEGKI
jgi:DNA-binding NtrC family response regulator